MSLLVSVRNLITLDLATSRNEELEQKTMEKREAQRKKFAAYKEKRKAQEEERKKKLAERPAWRPAGAAVTRR